MHHQRTHELKIFFKANARGLQTKELVKVWLNNHDCKEFVEYQIDQLDIDVSSNIEAHKLSEQYENNSDPISIFKYDKTFLQNIANQLSKSFDISFQFSSLRTRDWQNGWKKSFKPITTKCFYIYPPWHKKKPQKPALGIVIEPGMAFGTGQHETTKLCLKMIETLFNKNKIKKLTALDLGCGTGILAIACKKLGCREVFATDIDPDALKATRTNSRINGTVIKVSRGSFPKKTDKFTLIIANILEPVIIRLLPKMVKALKPNGVIILSGLLVDQKKQIMDVAENHGLKKIARKQLHDWLCLAFKG